MPKKKWKKPRLTVLSKGKPEEAVIETCKGEVVGGNPFSSYVQCVGQNPGCGWCYHYGNS